jgi:cell division septation protein DedD
MFESVRDVSLRTIVLVAVVVWATLAAVWFLSLGSGSPAQPAPARDAAPTRPPSVAASTQPATTEPVAVPPAHPQDSGSGQDVVVSTPPVKAPTSLPAAEQRDRGFALQAGAFQSEASAQTLLGRIRGDGFPAFLQKPAPGDSLYRVLVGPFQDKEQAETRREALKARGIETFVKALSR